MFKYKRKAVAVEERTDFSCTNVYVLETTKGV